MDPPLQAGAQGREGPVCVGASGADQQQQQVPGDAGEGCGGDGVGSEELEAGCQVAPCGGVKCIVWALYMWTCSCCILSSHNVHHMAH